MSEKKKPVNVLVIERKGKLLDTSDFSAGRIMGLYSNVDFRNGHTGLLEIVRKDQGKDFKFEDILPGNFFVFFNNDLHGMKLLGAGEAVIYIRRSHKIDKRIVQALPGQVFNIRKPFVFDNAMDRVIDKLLPERIRKEVEMNS